MDIDIIDQRLTPQDKVNRTLRSNDKDRAILRRQSDHHGRDDSTSLCYGVSVRESFAELETNFQKKTIDSAQFGRKLIELFASKNFSKQKAEEFFNKVRLKDWVNRLFKLQENGVVIYLVSSGPNYYVDVLASRKKVPIERTICSTYYFDRQRRY